MLTNKLRIKYDLVIHPNGALRWKGHAQGEYAYVSYQRRRDIKMPSYILGRPGRRLYAQWTHRAHTIISELNNGVREHTPKWYELGLDK